MSLLPNLTPTLGTTDVSISAWNFEENDKLIKLTFRETTGVCVSACLPECVLGKVGFANF